MVVDSREGYVHLAVEYGNRRVPRRRTLRHNASGKKAETSKRGPMQVPWRKRISRIIRGELRARVLSKHGEGILANTRNGLLIVDPRDFSVSRALLTHGAYDWAAIEWLCRILAADS